MSFLTRIRRIDNTKKDRYALVFSVLITVIIVLIGLYVSNPKSTVIEPTTSSINISQEPSVLKIQGEFHSIIEKFKTYTSTTP